MNIKKYCKSEQKKIEKEYDDLINSYQDIEAMNGEEAHALGRWTAYEDVIGMLEDADTKQCREDIRQGRCEI